MSTDIVLLTIIEDIKRTLVPEIKKWVDSQVKRILEVQTEYKKLMAGPDWRKLSGNWAFWQDFYNNKCGKTIWHRLQYEHEPAIRAYFEKLAKAKLDKIDFAVRKKVTDYIVKCELVGRINQGEDGYFEGTWRLTTDAGVTMYFGFRSILAGGYNIQCLHIRTLYNYK
jgi:hypothetical protein